MRKKVKRQIRSNLALHQSCQSGKEGGILTDLLQLVLVGGSNQGIEENIILIFFNRQRPHFSSRETNIIPCMLDKEMKLPYTLMLNTKSFIFFKKKGFGALFLGEKICFLHLSDISILISEGKKIYQSRRKKKKQRE